MHRVQRAERLSSVPLPADYFDLICGTSTGGLIALLLGRLRLSVPEAIDKYRTLAKKIFSEKKARGKDGTFKASNLEKAIKDIVQEKLGPDHADERMFMNSGGCKTFVCAMPAKHMNKEPRLFRTWSADENPGYNCTIWEAGRATSAAPTFFKRIKIGDPELKEEFIDAGMGCNNPVRYLIEEAQREFGPTKEVSCIISIGTGKPKVTGFDAPGLFQRALPLDLAKALVRMATDSEAEAETMKARCQNCPGLYHRLNVERGLEEVSLEEWDKLGDVKTHTMAYLRGHDISNDINVIVDALVGRPSQTFRSEQLGIYHRV
ncbi:acyl transferase/acyl hydrolase/lysophospholipase [Tricladium varicosporioides]|nr:acyl transferase/acyl hydrolase/lysophospholipase [Hymenoscyphus varicosporioides]